WPGVCQGRRAGRGYQREQRAGRREKWAAAQRGCVAERRAAGRCLSSRPRHDRTLADVGGESPQAQSHDLPPQIKLVPMLGTYLRQHYHGRCYAKAQNLRPGLRASYDAVLHHVGVLAMPTTPMKAQAFRPQRGIQERITHGWNRLGNTVPFDMTGDPSIRMPCAQSDGWPVGRMRTERHCDDATVLAVAHAFEPQVDWRNAEA